MAGGKALEEGQKGSAVRAFQEALNARAETRFYPPLVADGAFGPATRHAFEDLGYALGLNSKDLSAKGIPAKVQAIFVDPDQRTPQQLGRARTRGPKLKEHTIAFDGTPIFWGLAKPLLRARQRGWQGTLSSADRRPGVPERYGKKSQKTLFECAQKAKAMGRCPAECGECNPANEPGFSSHELHSDGAAFGSRPRGAKLPWWELGLDVGGHTEALAHLKALGYDVRQTYPGSPSEAHHINFSADPGPLLPPTGPNTKPARKPPLKAVAKKAKATTGRLAGIDIAEFQPDIDWDEVAASGRTFAYSRVTDGLKTPDKVFGKGRWKAMRDAGIARGGYHFARPQKGRDPKDEVREFLAVLKRAGGLQDGDLVPMLDVEAYGGAGKLTAAQTLEWLRGFVTEMHAKIGRRPIIYTGFFWREAMGNPADDLDCELWLAAYAPSPEPWVPNAWKDRGWRIWQRSDKGKVPGIPGVNVDIDVLRGGTAALERLRM
jgi:lysozyme